MQTPFENNTPSNNGSNNNESNQNFQQRRRRRTNPNNDGACNNDNPQPTKITPILLKSITIASLGGILFGYDLGVISTALPQLQNSSSSSSFSLTHTQAEMVVSFLYIGAIIGSVVGGHICDTYGRKTSILFVDIMFMLGSMILYTSTHFWNLLLGRIVVGLGVSISAIADVSYLHEVSPVEWRGSIVSLNEGCIGLGFLIAYGVGYVWNGYVDDEEGWRGMFGMSGWIALGQFVGMWGMVESPSWLRERGRVEDAQRAETFLMLDQGGGYRRCVVNSDDSGENDDEEEEREMGFQLGGEEGLLQLPEDDDDDDAYQQTAPKQEHPTTTAEATTTTSSPLQQILIPMTRTHTRQTIIALFLSISQQFCGHTNVLNFAPTIFGQIGLFTDSTSTLLCTVLLGIFKFIATVIVIWKVEYFGRRRLLLVGVGMIVISLSFLAIGIVDDQQQQTTTTSIKSILALIGMFGVVLGYAISFGPLSWLITSELFPTHIRGRMLGFSTVVTYACAVLVSYTFLSVQDYFGGAASVPFWGYMVITAGGWVFVWLGVPDTGGLSVGDIGRILDEMWFWRRVWRTRRRNGGGDWDDENVLL